MDGTIQQKIGNLDSLDQEHDDFAFDPFENLPSFKQYPYKGDTTHDGKSHFQFNFTEEMKESSFMSPYPLEQSLGDADETHHVHVYWKNLYNEELKKNERMKFEKEAFALIVKSYSQTISIDEFEKLIEIPGDLKEKYDKLMKKEDEISIQGMEKKYMEMDSYEFMNQILLEFPEISFAKVKLFLQKRNEALKILKDFSDLKVTLIMNIMQELLDTFSDFPNEEEKIKKIEQFQKAIEQEKVEARCLLEKEFIQFIEKTMKGKNNPLPDDSKTILRTWFLNNFKHPYPTDSEKNRLQAESGLTRTQVNNWFINKRVRVWRPLIQKLFPNSKGKIDDSVNNMDVITSLTENLNKDL